MIRSLSLMCCFVTALSHPLGYSYGSPKQQEKTQVDVQKVEVYEVQWVGDQQPQTTHGAPSPTYDPPQVDKDYTTTESTSSVSSKLQEGPKEQGQYYIYHPDGLLQKVSYLTKDDAANMAFSAQLKYQNVEPVKGPIYTYDPETFVFSRINK